MWIKSIKSPAISELIFLHHTCLYHPPLQPSRWYFENEQVHRIARAERVQFIEQAQYTPLCQSPGRRAKFTGFRIFNRISTGSSKFQPCGCRIGNFVLKNRSGICLIWKEIHRMEEKTLEWIPQETISCRIDRFRSFFLRIFLRIDLSGWLTQGSSNGHVCW